MGIFKLIFCIFVISVCVILIFNIVRDELKKEKTKISFKESLDLVELPVITFMNNNKKLNLLIDSGSDISYLCKKVVPELNLVSEEEIGLNIMTGIKSMNSVCNEVKLNLSFKDNNFVEKFIILPELDHQFDDIKKENGVKIDGILGNSFLSKYKYIIDYKDLSVYMK